MGTKNKKKYKLLSLLMAFALLVTTCLPMSAMAAGTEGADCVKVSSTAPTEEETVAGAKYELDLSKVFTDSDSHSLTYTLENTDLGGYTQIKDHTLYFTENKPGKYNVKLKATCTSGKSATHTLAMTVKAAAEGSKDQYSYEETAAEKVTVWVTMSNDGVPLMGNDEDSTKLSHLKVTVPYFDLSAYGLGQFARKGTAKDPNMGHKGDYINNTVIERPTYLHLLIWLTERYYLGLSESECGKGQDSSHVIDNTNTTSVKTIFGKEAYSSNGLSAFGLKDGTASATSMLINNLWGHDMNFMYLRNHVYPLMDAGWGATADYILLSDNDVLDIALFSDWTFYQRGAFNKFDQEVYTAEPGSDLIFSTLKYDTQSPSDGGAGDFTKIDKLNIGLYNADWEKVSDVEIDGSGGDYYIDVLPDVEGTYYLLGMDPLADTENSYTACYAPAVAELDIKKADPFEGMPFTDLYYMDGDKKVQLTKIEELEGGLSCTDYPTYKNLPAYKVTIPEELASKGLTVYAKIKTTESITTSMANFSVVSQAVDWNNTLTATATKDGEETLVSFNIPEEKASIYIGENANYAVVQTTGWSGVMGFSFVGGDISDEPKPTDPYEGMPFTDLYYMDGDKKVQLTKIEAVEGGLSCTDYPTYKNLPAYKVTIPEELASKGLTVYAKIKTTESITTSMANFSVVSQAVDWNNTLTATATKDGEKTLVSFNIPEEKASIYIGENANYAVVQTTGWSGVMGFSFVGGDISDEPKPTDPYEGMPFTDLYYMDGGKKVQLTKIEAVEGGLSCTDYPTYKNLPAYKVTIPEELASKGLTVYAKIKTTESITTSMANFSVVSQAVDWNNTLTATATKDGEETLISFNIPEEKASIYIGENANYAVVQTTGWSGVMGFSFVGGTIDSGNDKPSDGKVTGVTLNKTSLTMPRWSTATLTATVQPEAAKVKIVKWSSSDDSIVSVEKGVLTSHKAGKADITVMTVQNEKTATCHVTVTDPDMPPTDTDGTYEVSTAKQLLWISNQAEATSTKYKGTSMNVKLMNDIDLSEVCGESKGSWKPISIFCGTFDGQNHKIKNIYGEYAGPNDPTGNSIPGYGGLFGRVREATIKNLSVYGTVKATGAEYYASTNVGAICGSASDATIENCHNYASVTGVGGRLESVAGIVAYLSLGSKVENCSNHGTISGNKPGGIASTAYLSSENGDGIFNCWNEGIIDGDNSSTAGGIICSTGITSMTIENCYNTGAVSAAGWGYKDRASVGGIAGGASSSFGNTYTFRNCYNRGNLSSTVPNALIGAITPVQDEKTGYVFENCYYVEGTMNPSDSVAAVKEVKSSELPATLLGTGYQESCPTPVLATQSAVAHADSDGDGICDTCGKVMKVTSGYIITAGEAKTVNITEDAQLTLKVGSADSDTTYNSYVVKVSYDSNVLEYKGINGTDNDTDGSRRIVEDDKAGTLTITGYGKDRTIGTDNIELTFTGKKAGAGQVKVVSANIDKQENANAKDAPPATILDGGSSMITVSDYYPVIFDDNLFNGSHLAQNGKRYSLNVTDIHYDYQVSVTMNGEAVDVKKYEDSTSGYFYFYIDDVTGPLKFTGTRMEKNYTVTKDENGTGSTDLTLLGETATYLQDYTFTVDQKEGYTYTVTVTCGGETYTGLEQPTPGSYKIPGTDVTGDLVIKVDKTVDDTKWTKISFTGTGSGDVKEGLNQSGLNNKDFTFEITKAEGFTYKVTLNDGTVLNPNDNGIYMIPAAKMTGTALTVTVEKKGELTIEVSNYLTMKNSQTMWLVTAKGAVNTGKTLAYGTGGNMFWSEKYNAYAFLVVSGDNESQVKDAATAAIVEATAEKQTVTYNSDINGTGNVDINDAQLVYNMYNAMYDDFTDVTMEKFLKADVNRDKTVNVNDAAAVVNELIKTN